MQSYEKRPAKRAKTAFHTAADVVGMPQSERERLTKALQETPDLTQLDSEGRNPWERPMVGGDAVYMTGYEAQAFLNTLYGEQFNSGFMHSDHRMHSFGERLRHLRFEDVRRLQEEDLKALSMLVVMTESALYQGRIAELVMEMPKVMFGQLQFETPGKQTLANIAYVLNNAGKIAGSREIPRPGVTTFEPRDLQEFGKSVDAFAAEYFERQPEGLRGEEEFYEYSRDYIANRMQRRPNAMNDLYLVKDLIVAASVLNSWNDNFRSVFKLMAREADAESSMWSKKEPEEVQWRSDWENPALWTCEIDRGEIAFDKQSGAGFGRGHLAVHFDPRSIGFAAMAVLMQKEQIRRATNDSASKQSR